VGSDFGSASHDAVLAAIQKAALKPLAAEVGMIPKNLMELEGKKRGGHGGGCWTRLKSTTTCRTFIRTSMPSEEDVED